MTHWALNNLRPAVLVRAASNPAAGKYDYIIVGGGAAGALNFLSLRALTLPD